MFPKDLHARPRSLKTAASELHEKQRKQYRHMAIEQLLMLASVLPRSIALERSSIASCSRPGSGWRMKPSASKTWNNTSRFAAHAMIDNAAIVVVPSSLRLQVNHSIKVHQSSPQMQRRA